ncbi:MAG: hypothetical protein AAGJ46_14070 [Planctomycetota bacterium]
MSSNSSYSLGPSDSGLLDAILGVEQNEKAIHRRLDGAGGPTRPTTGPSDARIDRNLSDVPLPSGLIERLKQEFEP